MGLVYDILQIKLLFSQGTFATKGLKKKKQDEKVNKKVLSFFSKLNNHPNLTTFIFRKMVKFREGGSISKFKKFVILSG